MMTMSERIEMEENGLFLTIEVTEEKDVRLLHFDHSPLTEDLAESQKNVRRLVEVQVSGENQNDHHSMKHTGTMPGARLIFVRHDLFNTAVGKRLKIIMKDEKSLLNVTWHAQFYNDIPIIRTWTELGNEGGSTLGIEYVSSFASTGVGEVTEAQDMMLYLPHNTWYGEGNWKACTLKEMGYYPVNDFSMKRIHVTNTGTWSSSEFAPVGILEKMSSSNTLFWQIEHNGSWHWEISDIKKMLYLQCSGPSEAENHWWKSLHPGEHFSTVPVAAGVVEGGMQDALQSLTNYRRAIRRDNWDNKKLPVIFNDYMNCLFGDPTTEKLLPLIDAAAEAGCEIYCIDCGWYADGKWWDEVGEWYPSTVRFPGGITEVIDKIKKRDMIPGLWLEIEVMGINSKIAANVPDDWFFCRHGRRVIDHSRYQLDFRNLEVRKYATGVVERLVNEYDIGYIKMDYNINAGIGTEIKADSFGDGLLEHNRAYLTWLDYIFQKFPDLIIENCGSGGMRMDYALLQRHSVQSTSDQTDYIKNGIIAASSATLVTPEQAAVWSYPLKDAEFEAVAFNMINSMLVRIHQSGELSQINSTAFDLIKEAIACYKEIRAVIPMAEPVWPTGIPNWDDAWMSFGLIYDSHLYLAIWRIHGEESSFTIPLDSIQNKEVDIQLKYPVEADINWERGVKEKNNIIVNIPTKYSARLLEIEIF